MKQLICKYLPRREASLMLLLVYSLHLFTFHSLLSNPKDFLSASSFSDYKGYPDKCSNCLLLLAKQSAAKQNTIEDESLVVTYASSKATYVAPPITILFLRKLPCLSENSYKLYRLIRCFLI